MPSPSNCGDTTYLKVNCKGRVIEKKKENECFFLILINLYIILKLRSILFKNHALFRAETHLN